MYYKVDKNCSSCRNRHCCPWGLDECGEDFKSKYWELGKCYLCKHRNATEDEWFTRECEVWCFGGCRKFKRDWKATLKYMFTKQVDIRS